MQSYAKHASFLTSLEGLRAVAAIAIVLTHVAFQTGTDPATFLGGILARFDFFVAVFFTLSAFLLWRRWGVSAPVRGRRWRDYYRSRLIRIFPPYVAFVGTVLLVFPDAYGAPLPAALANLTLTQIYLPAGLLPGLTHLWSLCVEVAFYAALPALAWTVGKAPSRLRIPLIVAGAALSLGWAFLPFVAASPAPGVPNMQIFPPGFACWFAAGILAAEVEGRVTIRRRWPWWCLATAALIIAAQPFFGPLGLVHPTPAEFARRVLAGTIFGAAVVIPVALAPAASVQRSLLSTKLFGALGRWSYGIFLWHLPVLGFVFPLLGIKPFTGHFTIVALATIAVTIPISAAAHVLIENPVKMFFSKKKKN